MKKVLLVVICAVMLSLGVEQSSRTQTKQEKSLPEPEKNKTKIVALHPHDSEPLHWDGGKVRFMQNHKSEMFGLSGR